MKLDYIKYHALGNDYIVIDPNKTKLSLTKKNIQLICHRHFGLGADGVLYGPDFDDGIIKLRFFNPDGSEAEKSGNGILIFSKYLFDQGYIRKSCTLDTLGGEVLVVILDDNGDLINADMGGVTFCSESIPLAGPSREVIDEVLELDNRSLRITCLSIGNPHCVVLTNMLSEELAKKLGPVIEKHPMFPNRINVQFLKILDRKNIKIEIWERGANYILASGSSSCAAASTAFKLGLVDNQIKVHMPGGVIYIDIKHDGNVHMTGKVSRLASGAFSDELWQELG